MKQVADLPAIFARYVEADGVLQHYIFENAGSDEAAARAAILACVPTIDATGLGKLASRQINRAQFLGSWCPQSEETLVFNGSIQLSDGRFHTSPTYDEIGDQKTGSSAFSRSGEPCDGGDYAYAFAVTPYGLKASHREIQSMFSSVMEIILPRDEEAVILDWASPTLVEVAPFFRHGAQWWGVFLFTIQIPRLRKLIVIAGSTTD